MAYGFMPLRLTVVGTAWGLVELVVAGQLGARLYREDTVADGCRAAAGDRIRGQEQAPSNPTR